MTKIVALLPMKAQSIRVPNKNFKELSNKPLFEWILESLINIDQISNIVINTDAIDILKGFDLINNEKIIIKERKLELCGDLVSMNKIIENDLDDFSADIYLMTHTTNPFLSSNTIRESIKVFNKLISEEKYDSLFSVNKVQTRFYSKDSSPINHDPDKLVRTQDLEPWYEENSCLYLFSKDSFMNTNARIGKNPFMYETPKLESIDIDNSEDWELAEALGSFMKSKLKKTF